MEKVKAISNDLINKYSILNVAKYFPSAIFQNYLVFIPVALVELIRGNLIECQKEALKI